MKKIKVIIKRPDEAVGHVTRISDSLKNLQKTVEGPIEVVTIAPNLVIICNEEGKIRRLEPNCRILGEDFVGTIIIAGANGEYFDDVPVDLKWLRDRL